MRMMSNSRIGALCGQKMTVLVPGMPSEASLVAWCFWWWVCLRDPGTRSPSPTERREQAINAQKLASPPAKKLRDSTVQRRESPVGPADSGRSFDDPWPHKPHAREAPARR